MSAIVAFSQQLGPKTSEPGTPGAGSATLVGSSAIFLWAVWPALAVFAAPAPTFQVLAMGMAVGFLTLAALRLARGERLRDMVPKSFGLLIAGIIGILGTNAFNFIAVTHISPAQASVIAYLWPMMALVLAAVLKLRTLNRRHYIAVIAGFLGAVFVIDPFGGAELNLIGIGSAFLAGLSFAAYTTYRMIDDKSASDAVGIYALVAALVCGAIHLSVETTVSLTNYQLAAVVALGLAPMGLAYAVWDYGVARGDARTLSVLAYGTPLVATVILVLLGLAEFTPMLIIGALLIVAGAAIGTWPSSRKE